MYTNHSVYTLIIIDPCELHMFVGTLKRIVSTTELVYWRVVWIGSTTELVYCRVWSDGWYLCLTKPSLSRIMQCRMSGWLVNNELEETWKEATWINLKSYPYFHLGERLRKITINVIRLHWVPTDIRVTLLPSILQEYSLNQLACWMYCWMFCLNRHGRDSNIWQSVKSWK